MKKSGVAAGETRDLQVDARRGGIEAADDTVTRLLAVYRAAAVDESAANDAKDICARAEELLTLAEIDRFADGGPEEAPPHAFVSPGEAFAKLRTAEVDLQVSLLGLAKKHLSELDWRTAAAQAAAVAKCGDLRLEAGRLLADALTKGAAEIVSTGDRAALEAWVAECRRFLISEAQIPELVDEVLLAGLDVVVAKIQAGPNPPSADARIQRAVVIGRAYVGIDPQDAARQRSAGDRLASLLRQYPPGRWMLPLITTLASSDNPHTDQLVGEIQRLESLEARMPSAFDAAYKRKKTIGAYNYDDFDEGLYRVAVDAWRKSYDAADLRVQGLLDLVVAGARFSIT